MTPCTSLCFSLAGESNQCHSAGEDNKDDSETSELSTSISTGNSLYLSKVDGGQKKVCYKELTALWEDSVEEIHREKKKNPTWVHRF